MTEKGVDEFRCFLNEYEQEIQQIKADILDGYGERIDEALRYYTDLLPSKKMRDIFWEEIGSPISDYEVFKNKFGVFFEQVPYCIARDDTTLNAFLAHSINHAVQLANRLDRAYRKEAEIPTEVFADILITISRIMATNISSNKIIDEIVFELNCALDRADYGVDKNWISNKDKGFNS
jgi:hypothetical protein